MILEQHVKPTALKPDLQIWENAELQCRRPGQWISNGHSTNQWMNSPPLRAKEKRFGIAGCFADGMTSHQILPGLPQNEHEI